MAKLPARLAAMALVAISAALPAGGQAAERIVYGRPTQHFAAEVMIWTRPQNPSCRGMLIDRAVLTAGHCVAGRSVLRVTVAASDGATVDLSATGVVVHPKYTPRSQSEPSPTLNPHDLAVVQVSGAEQVTSRESVFLAAGGAGRPGAFRVSQPWRYFVRRRLSYHPTTKLPMTVEGSQTVPVFPASNHRGQIVFHLNPDDTGGASQANSVARPDSPGRVTGPAHAGIGSNPLVLICQGDSGSAILGEQNGLKSIIGVVSGGSSNRGTLDGHHCGDKFTIQPLTAADLDWLARYLW